MEVWESPLWSLLDRPRGWVSWKQIERLCSRGVEEVRTYLGRLSEEGFSLEEDPIRGCRILSRPDRLFPPWILTGLRTQMFGSPLFYAHTMDSTQKEAVQRLRQGATEGTVVICEYQLHGRGRRGRQWASPPCSNILMSVVARAPNEASEAFVWTQIASLAVAESVENVIQDRVWIKWPNDLVLSGRKLCGVLAEREEMPSGEAFMVVGIGLNVQSAPEEASEAICLRDVTSRLPRRTELVRSILEGFETRCNEFRRHGSEAIREPWMARSLLIGKQVQVEEEGRVTRGWVEDFLPDGRLLLCSEDRSRRVFAAGDVSVLPQQANL